MIPPDLYAKPGQNILEKWNQLLDWQKRWTLYAGSQVKLTVTPDGTWINVVSRAAWLHPFRVSVSADLSVRVRHGSIDGDVPRIRMEGEWIRIDGTDMEYRPHPDGQPVLDIGGDALESGRSMVAARVVVNDQGEMDVTDPAANTVVHVPDWDSPERTVEAGVGYQPLAVLYWQGDRVVQRYPVVHHHLIRYYRPGNGDRPEAHFFGAV